MGNIQYIFAPNTTSTTYAAGPRTIIYQLLLKNDATNNRYLSTRIRLQEVDILPYTKYL